jgi:hypothetical protein
MMNTHHHERYQRLCGLAKRAVDNPRSGGIKTELIQATRRYVKLNYPGLSEEAALALLYDDPGELGTHCAVRSRC